MPLSIMVLPVFPPPTIVANTCLLDNSWLALNFALPVEMLILEDTLASGVAVSMPFTNFKPDFTDTSVFGIAF